MALYLCLSSYFLCWEKEETEVDTRGQGCGEAGYRDVGGKVEKNQQ